MATEKTMKAIAYKSYGGPEVMDILEFPVPEPGPSEVQVRVTAGGLNPLDYKERDGALKLAIPLTFPAIAGNEFSGVITATGANVSGFSVGDAIICRIQKDRMDSFSEYVVVPADICAKAPTAVTLVEAAGLPLAGLTALQAFEHMDLKAGEHVLITGGAGGVGQFAIQLAKVKGAIVTTTASPAGEKYVKAAGADHIINYRTETIPADSFDKCFDTVGGDALHTQVIPSIHKGGIVISVGGPPTPGCMDRVLPWWKRPIINAVLYGLSWTVSSAASKAGVKYEYFFMVPSGEQLTYLANLVNDSKLKINVEAVHKFDDFREAYKTLESGRAKGKVIIDFAK